MPDDDRLHHVLAEIQRRGGIGSSASLPDEIEHARRFVAAIPEDASLLVDLGSGGGLPGLVIAADRPVLRVVLVERRAKRADLLSYGARALQATDRIEVVATDVEDVIRAVLAGDRPTVDVVTARSFGPLVLVLSSAAPLLRPGGRVIVSLPPDDRDAGIVAHDAFEQAIRVDGMLVAVRH